jgi:hypothetical protein
VPTDAGAAAARATCLRRPSRTRVQSHSLARGHGSWAGRRGRGPYRTRALVASATTLSVVFAPAATAQAANAERLKQSASEAAEAGRWSLVIALAFLVLGIPIIALITRGLWWTLKGRREGGQRPTLWWGKSLVVGEDNRVSTSKTTALIWTYSVAGALLSFLIARWLGHSAAFHRLTTQGLNAQYAVLMGGPLGAAILAKGIVSSQVSSGSAAKTRADAPTPAQLVQNDAGQADLGDLQYVLFNLIALFFFYGEVLRAPQLGMPTIPDVLVGLTGVSATGFVAKKVLAGPAGISSVEPEAGPVGEMVTIATAGLVQSADDVHGVSVLFGAAKASPGTLSVTTTTSLGELIEAQVPAGAAGCVDVTVSVPTAQPATWSGFKIVPRIAPGQNLIAPPGGTLPVTTSGVTGLGRKLPGLRATIGGEKALTEVSDAGDLLVMVPAHAPTGATKLVLATPGGSDEAPITIQP